MATVAEQFWREVLDIRRVGAENASTSGDLGIFLDEGPQTIDPHDADVPGEGVGGTAVSGEACPSARCGRCSL